MQAPTEEQQQFIEDSDYPEAVKAKVKRLLQYDVEQVDITHSIIDSVRTSLDIKRIEPGLRIDAYQLIEPIGEGGQGEVWLAQRVAGDFEHQVAIKFLKPIHDQKELTRFSNERELLAQLKHNNIAQLIGGGELYNDSKSPRPYMILELVEGMPLLSYCQQKNLTLNQYLKLFLQICDAISYAHAHLIVHRDIKPSNIIVTQEGVVKLLDFGIAKTLESDALDTQTVPIMTLAYSSPEQVSGAPISTATDVYILGLLLYELLTGKRAQAVDSEVPTDMIHQITEKIPIVPSRVTLSTDADRHFNHRRLQGDLDNLIMKAIRKEPHRRYQSVAAMADDIKNFLDGKPVSATGDSTSYKLKKLFSRNKLATTLGAAVLFFLITLPIVLYDSQQKISQQRDAEMAARIEAQKQADIATSTKDFLVNILESASPLANQGQDISLQDVLANSERQLEHGLNDHPIIKAELINTLSSIHHHLGNSQKAIEFYQQSLPIYEANHDVAGQVKTLGQLAVVSVLHNDAEGASQYAKQAQNLSKQLTDPIQIAWHNSRMATWQGRMGQAKTAQETLQKTLNMLLQDHVVDHELLGRLYNELAITSNDNEQALEFSIQSLYHAEQDHGKVHPKYFNRLVNKAKRLRQLKQMEAAANTFNQAADIGMQLYDQNHPFLARLYGELAVLYHDTGEFSAAQENYLKAMYIDKNKSGVESLTYALGTNNLAYLYEDMGSYEQAVALFRESLALREKYFSDDAFRVASTQFNLARVLAKTGMHQESEALIEQVIPVYQSKKRSVLGAEIVQLANQLGQHAGTEMCQQAEPTFNRLKSAVEKTSAQSWVRMYNELWLGEMAQRCELTDMASEWLQAALNHSKSIYQENSEGQITISQTVQALLNP